MNATRTTRQILRLGLISALMIGLQMRAQSASSGTTNALKTNAQRLTDVDTAATAQMASATAAAKAESLTVANKEYDAAKELARMTKRYSLTKEQRATIQPLLLEQQRQVHALGEDESLTDAEWAGSVRKVHQQTVLKVRKQLTDAQLSKYMKDELKRAKQSGNDSEDADDDGPPPYGPPPGGGGGPGGGGPGGGGPGGGPPD